MSNKSSDFKVPFKVFHGESAAICHIFSTCFTRLCTRQRVRNVCLIVNDCHILSIEVCSQSKPPTQNEELNTRHRIKGHKSVIFYGFSRNSTRILGSILWGIFAVFLLVHRFAYLCTFSNVRRPANTKTHK